MQGLICHPHWVEALPASEARPDLSDSWFVVTRQPFDDHSLDKLSHTSASSDFGTRS